MTANKLLKANSTSSISQLSIHQDETLISDLTDHSNKEVYKDSSIGLIPADWKEEAVGEVCNLQTGGTPSRSKPEFWNGNIPWIKTGEVNYCVIKEAEEYITQSGLENSNAKIFPKGTLLIAMYGQGVTRGKVALMGIEAATNQACAAVTPKDPGELCTEFLYFFLQYSYEELRNRGHGANQKNLSATLIKLFPVVFPPTLNEQRKIAYVLSTVQRAIAQQEQIIQITTELKKSLIQKLFTEGLYGEKQKETAIGLVPESWEVKPCEIICHEITVGIVVKPASYYVPNGVPAFRSLNVREDKLATENLVFVSPEDNDKKLSKSKLKSGDVLIVRTGYPGTSCVVPEKYDGSNCIDVVIAKPRHEVMTSEFFSRYFNSESGKRQVLSSKHGLAQQHLNVGAVKRTLIPTPPRVEEQKEITGILDMVDRKKELAEDKQNALSDLFQTLLHQLMTAQIRVHDIDLPGFDESATITP